VHPIPPPAPRARRSRPRCVARYRRGKGNRDANADTQLLCRANAPGPMRNLCGATTARPISPAPKWRQKLWRYDGAAARSFFFLYYGGRLFEDALSETTPRGMKMRPIRLCRKLNARGGMF